MLLIPKRDLNLSDETARQQTNERLRVQFAQMANQVGQWIEQRQQRMIDIGMNARGTLETQLQELKSLDEEIQNFKEHILELDNINKVRHLPFSDHIHVIYICIFTGLGYVCW